MSEFHLYLVSDATGETVESVARACLVQFEHTQPIEHVWNLVRSQRQIKDVISEIEERPGFVLFTLVNKEIITRLQTACRKLKVPCVSVLQPIMSSFGNYLHEKGDEQPGRQHTLDEGYYERIAAMDYAMTHDDGQATWNLEAADVVILGVSRTSKTPTCIYLANRGIKAANIPIILGQDISQEVFELDNPLIIGLVKDSKSLVQVRRNRLRMLTESEETSYADPEVVNEEVNFARRLFMHKNINVIDVSRRSIEETAAAIIQYHSQHIEFKS
ncbi:MAG TPA: kinase/pyrophosphorylase [Rhodospirillales bacterium]|nr:kinase/pyrophosphorylase [Rhodospirillales bacterium]HIL74060.1 kinase/pyrophosphorylase [Rhodospirillales bacterium]